MMFAITRSFRLRALAGPASKSQRFFSSSRIFKDGTIELLFGGALLTALALDQVFQYQQGKARENVMNQVRFQTQARGQEDSSDFEKLLNMTSMFDCIVRKVPSNLDGYRCLTGVSVGDVVQVLEEKVGPGKMYNLCRKMDAKGRPVSVGWFPTMYLEKK